MCSAAIPLARIPKGSPVSDTRTYTISGMTCQHCVASVREEVSEIPAVRDVDVDLDSGRLTVSGEELSDADIRAAVEEAGYEVVS